MFSFTEIRGQSSLLHPRGGVDINTSYVTRKKPAWWVLFKLLLVAGMVAIGMGIGVPTLLEFKFPFWQAVVITTGVMFIYIGVAFFFRPEANTDNMGWAGGAANDPFQYSDNVNRFLWKAHCFLGPGRFTSETLLDLCVLLGIAGGDEVIDENAEQAAMAAAATSGLSSAFDPTQPIAPTLSANRFEQPPPGNHGGQVQLDSWKYLQQQAQR